MSITCRLTARLVVASLFAFALFGESGRAVSAHPADPAPRETKTVLAIHWGTEDSPGAQVLNATLRESLAARSDVPVQYFAEYLEADALPATRAANALAAYIASKFGDRRIDLVIADADAALEFVLDHRERLFPGAPIVYTGIREPRAFPQILKSGITGVVRSSAYLQTLDLAVKTQPAVDRVYVVANSVESSAAAVRDVLRDWKGPPITFLESGSVERLLADVEAIPPSSIVLFIWHGPSRASYLHDHQLVTRVAEASRAPVYVTREEYVGAGAMGGMVIDRAAAAGRMAAMAKEILSGRSADSLPVEPAPVKAVFDWRQLGANNVQASQLPSGADLRFQPPPLWPMRGYVIASVIIFLVQLGLIGGLLGQRARRRRAENKIRGREAALRHSFDRIRKLTGRLINAQESTRAAIARDLHDDVCQELVTVALGVSTLKATSGGLSEQDSQQALSRLQDLTMDSVDRVRRLSHDLHPATLRTLGLQAALRSHCIEVEKRYDVQVSLDVSPNVGHVPPEPSLCLFRITQEALRNGAVHGDARRLSVSLSRSGDDVELLITDDGNGFDVESVRRDGSGLGLVSMEERAHLADGVMTITSRVWHGTTVRVHLQLPADDAAAPLLPTTVHLSARAS